VKRALAFIGVLALALVVGLGARVHQLRAREHGPVGGSGVIEGVDVNIQTRIATRITQVLVREGDSVRRGQLLVELDCSETEAALDEARSRLRAAEATVRAARENASSAGRSAVAALDGIRSSDAQLAALKSQSDLAHLDLDRTQRLFADEAVNRAALDSAQSRADTLTNQIDAQRATASAARAQAEALSGSGRAAVAQALVAESNVDVARASLARAEVNGRECKLYAPRDAMVETRALEPGEAVLPGSVVLTLTDLSEARTRFYLPNEALGFAAPGRPVQVVADAYPGERFTGTIYYVSPRAEFTPRNVQTRADRERLVYAVEVRLPNPGGRLRSGMPVEVTIDKSWR